MRKLLPKQKKRSVMTQTLLQPNERRQVESKAKETGTSVSSVIRKAILKDLVPEGTNK